VDGLALGEVHGLLVVYFELDDGRGGIHRCGLRRRLRRLPRRGLPLACCIIRARRSSESKFDSEVLDLGQFTVHQAGKLPSPASSLTPIIHWRRRPAGSPGSVGF
jgi:hypothetical protein